MKRYLLAILIWVIGVSCAFAQGQQLCYTENGSNCLPAIQASHSVAINIASATTTQLVALSTTKAIFVTSWDLVGGGVGNVTFKYGTGTNCGTGTTSLTGPYPLIAQTVVSKGNGMGLVLAVPKGNALCITTSAASQVSGSLSYSQF